MLEIKKITIVYIHSVVCYLVIQIEDHLDLGYTCCFFLLERSAAHWREGPNTEHIFFYE